MPKLFPGNQKGQVMIIIIGMIAVLGVLTSTALVFARSQFTSGEQQRRLTKAYYIADAGITKAMSIIKNNPEILDNPQDLSISESYGDGKIETVTLSDPLDGKYTITSTGVYPNPDIFPNIPSTRRTITAQIEYKEGEQGDDSGDWYPPPPGGDDDDDDEYIPPGGGTEPGGESYFATGLWANSVIINSNNVLKTSIYSYGNVTVNSNAQVGDYSQSRNIYANGSVTLNSGSNIWGNIHTQGNITLNSSQGVSQNLKSLRNITLNSNNEISDSVLALGNIIVNSGSNFNKMQANGKIELNSNITINGTVKTQGLLKMNSNNHIKDSCWVMGNLNMNSNNTIDGTTWVHGTTTKNSGNIMAGGAFPAPPPYLDSMDPLELDIPDVPAVPLPDINWYKTEAQKTQGHYFSDSQSLGLGSFTSDGIYFIDGNLTFPSSSGAFSGKATIVASGNITVRSNKNITLSDPDNDSLLLIAGGRINMNSNNNIAAYLWANSVTLNSNIHLTGGIISPSIIMNSNNEIDQVELKQEVLAITLWN